MKTQRIELDDCYFEINQDEGGISIRKVATKVTNTDKIKILPHSSNKIFIY